MPRTRGKVYVIDGDASVQKRFATLFGSKNLLVETFATMREFLAAPRSKDGACILLGMDSLDAVDFDFPQKLVSLDMELPVIVTSASDDALIRERARDLGAATLLRTPVDKEAILDVVLWAIGGVG